MSKICENCGNMIPEGTDVCPGCGRQQYSDDALQSVLSELSFALDELQNEEPAESAEEIRQEVPIETAPETTAIEDIVAEREHKVSVPEKRVSSKATAAGVASKKASGKKKKKNKKGGGSTAIAIIAVSYTHLTLPTMAVV